MQNVIAVPVGAAIFPMAMERVLRIRTVTALEFIDLRESPVLVANEGGLAAAPGALESRFHSWQSESTDLAASRVRMWASPSISPPFNQWTRSCTTARPKTRC